MKKVIGRITGQGKKKTSWRDLVGTGQPNNVCRMPRIGVRLSPSIQAILDAQPPRVA